MIFADINWLNISINLLLVVFVIVCLLMALLILMQRPKQEGLGAAFGGGVTDQVFGARTTNVLQRGTVYLGSMFFILALVLAILIGKQSKQRTLLEPKETAVEVEPSVETETSEVPAVEPSPSLAADLPAEEATASIPDATTVAEEASEEVPAVEGQPAETVEASAEESLPGPAAPAAEENKADKSQ